MALLEILSERLTFHSSHHIRSMWGFVVQFGKSYVYQDLPKKYKHGFPKQCYYNAYRLASKHNLIYVEGCASSSKLFDIPFNHAWCCVPGTNQVIDPTTDLEEYIGVPFRREFVTSHWKRIKQHDTFSLIDNPSERFPLLSMSDEEIITKVVLGD